MKKRILLISVAVLVLAGAVAAGLFFFSGKGLKTVDNEYCFTLEGEWEGAKDFSEGLAAVKKDGKWGFIDTGGNVVIDLRYDSANSFSEGLAAVQNGGKWGYVDKNGTVVIPITLDATFAFSEGIAAYKSGYYFGYIDKEGNKVADAIYTEASAFREGVACVKKENRYGYIDKNGKEITEFVYGLESDPSEGMIPVFYGDTALGTNTGYLKTDGTPGLDFLWYDAKPFAEGLAAACDEFTKPYGYIDKTGAYVIAPAWDSAEPFSQGRALVEKERKFTFIDTTGAQITKAFYGKAYSFTESGFARVANSSAAGWSFGFLDKSGAEAISLKYDGAMDFHNGHAAVCKGEKWGFINAEGIEITGMLWTDANEFTEDGIARVRSGDTYGFVKLK